MIAPTTSALATGFGSGHPSEPVVAHILSHPGVQRTPSPKLTLFQKRGFIDAGALRAADRADRCDPPPLDRVRL